MNFPEGVYVPSFDSVYVPISIFSRFDLVGLCFKMWREKGFEFLDTIIFIVFPVVVLVNVKRSKLTRLGAVKMMRLKRIRRIKHCASRRSEENHGVPVIDDLGELFDCINTL